MQLLRLWEEEGADAIVCCFDLPGPTFRHDRYANYKATRKPMPDELAQQLPRVRETFAAMGVPVLDLKRYEADDLIGTLAREGEDLGHEIWIYSGDKDFIQLVRPAVRMLRPAPRAGSADEVLDEAAVKKKVGVRADQFRDVLALMGDASDNVPGVRGVGPKTAACVLLFACRKPVLPVDTHVHRVSRRLGLIGPKVGAARAHDDLAPLVPPRLVLEFHVGLIRHGRQLCTARGPKCEGCLLFDLCREGPQRLA